ncbi:TetR/AcrR family transcriptional regulator [Actinotalea sp. AC32]|nr:TetR/AcrR family transcriptional regulator [Actinotalea sp. AC32]
MSYRNPPPQPAARPGRPRDPGKADAILSATLSLLAEAGYDAVSMERVAARAGTSKATVYRRWPDKRALVAAAVGRQQGPPPPDVDTGSLRDDLLALCRRLAQMLGRSEGSLVVALLQGAARDPALGDLMERTAGHTGARLPDAVLRRAVARGELPATATAYAFDEVAGSALVLRALTGAPADDPYLEHLVDAVLLPALAHGDAGPPPGPALFAGATADDDAPDTTTP